MASSEQYDGISFDKFQEAEDFLKFECGKCKQELILKEFLYPGTAAAVRCGNCAEVWVVVSSPLDVVPIHEAPEEVIEGLSSEPFEGIEAEEASEAA